MASKSFSKTVANVGDFRHEPAAYPLAAHAGAAIVVASQGEV
jgi:hypothetical protein